MNELERAGHTLLWSLGWAACACACASDPAPASTSTGAGRSTANAASALVTSTTTSSTSTMTDIGTTAAPGNDINSSATGSGGAPSASAISGTESVSSQSATNSGTDSTSSFTVGSATSSVTNAGGASGSGTGGTGPLTATKVWLAGDSTMANGNTPCPTGWGKHLKQYLSDLVTVDNSAAGGRSVRTWLYNVTTEMDDETDECVLERDANGDPMLQARWQAMLDNMTSGDTLIVQFGINDGSATCDRHVGLDAFKESYGVMATAAKERGAEPVFLTPVSSIACDGSSPRGTRGAYVDATFEAGEEHGVPVIDLHQLSVELYGELGFCPVPGGDVSAETSGPVGDFFCDDHTHFSDAGAVTIAGVVANALRQQPLHLAGYVND